VKLALGAAVIGAVVYAARRAAAAVPDLSGIPSALWNGASAAAWAVNPLNPNNVAAATVNAGVSSAVGYEETLGGALYDLFNPDPVNSWKAPTYDGRSASQWDVTPVGGGRFNNPSAYVATTQPYSIWR